MPYINAERRKGLTNLVNAMHFADIDTAGDLNYLITQLVHVFLSLRPQSYQNYNDALGALEGAKLELYRQHIAGYEDLKIGQNGNVP